MHENLSQSNYADHLNTLRVVAAAGDWAQALKLYDEAVALHAAADILCERSRALRTLKRSAEALADVKRALSSTRDDRARLQQAVRASAVSEDPNEVIAMMSKVVEADSASTSALKQRAFAYEYLGKNDLARQDYAAAAKLGDTWAEEQLERK